MQVFTSTSNYNTTTTTTTTTNEDQFIYEPTYTLKKCPDSLTHSENIKNKNDFYELLKQSLDRIQALEDKVSALQTELKRNKVEQGSSTFSIKSSKPLTIQKSPLLSTYCSSHFVNSPDLMQNVLNELKGKDLFKKTKAVF